MRRVLVLEPDSPLREELLRILAAAGYAATAVESWSQARERLQLAAPDLWIVHLESPDDVPRLERRMQRHEELPVIAMVRERSPAWALALARCGVRAVLRKPFDLHELESQLEDVFRTGARPLLPERFVTRDPATLRTLRVAESLALRNATLLFTGESGTGKRLLARRVHQRGARAWRPIHEIDVSGDDALHAALERAGDAGSVILRHVDEASPRAQAHLEAFLRARAGAEPGRELPRVMATSTRPLSERVAAGRLRADLAHRLDVVSLRIPPLRERPCDLALLLRTLWERTGRRPEECPALTPVSLAQLAEHPFRGNVRELESRVRRMALARNTPADARGLLEPTLPERTPETAAPSLRDLERTAIVESLARHGNNRTHASRELGISVRTLRNKIQRYGLGEC